MPQSLWRYLAEVPQVADLWCSLPATHSEQVHAQKSGFISNSTLVKSVKNKQNQKDGFDITLSGPRENFYSDPKKIPPDKAPVRAVRAEQDGEHSESLRDRGWSRACPALSSITWILLLLSFMETLKCVHLSAT